MSKKHLKVNIADLSKLYKRVEDLYEEAAESMSESMVDPEVYDKFCRLKNKLDTSLMNYSVLLTMAYHDRPNFLKSYTRERETLMRGVDLLKQLAEQIESTPPEYISELTRKVKECSNRVQVYSDVDEVSCEKNRHSKFAKNLTFLEIRQLSADLRKLIQEEL